MPASPRQWEEFEKHAANYLEWLVDQDFDSLDRENALNYAFLAHAFDDSKLVGESGNRFQHLGGSNPTVSDILAHGDDGRCIWIEAKMRSAQCGQMVIEQDDDDGQFILASGNYKTAPIDYNDMEMPDIAGEYSPIEEYEDFDIGTSSYLDDVRDAFLYEMSDQYYSSGTEYEEAEGYDDDDSPIWNSKCFLYEDPLSYELVYAHYLHKDVSLFITKKQGVPYDIPHKGWLLFPLEYLDSYFSIWATYRYKRSGSQNATYDQALEALELFDEDVELFRESQWGWCVELDENTLDDAVVQGQDFRYKLLWRKPSDIPGLAVFQIRRLSNTIRPSVVMQMKVKPTKDLPYTY